MNHPTKNLPLALRLGLRDLASNKVATGVLIAIVALVIGVLAPALISARLSAYDARVWFMTDQAATYEPDTNGAPTAIQATTPGYVSFEQTQDMLAEVGLRALPQHLGLLTFPEFPDPFTVDLLAQNPDAAQDYPDGIPSAQVERWDSQWTDQDLQKLVPLLDGRLPEAKNEIAVERAEAAIDQPVLLPDLQVGQTVKVGKDGKQSEATVVGTYAAAPYLPEVLSYSASPGAAEPASLTVAAIGVGTPFTDEQALNLAAQFSTTFNDYWGSWSVRNLSLSPELAHTAAAASPLNPFELSMNSAQPLPIAFVGVLAFVSLLSVPLLWQNHRRREMQTEVLRRNGLSERSIWLTRLIPGLIVGLAAGALGLLISLAIIRLTGGNFGYSTAFGLGTNYAWAYLLALCLAAGVISMVVASVISQLVDLVAGKREPVSGDGAPVVPARRGFTFPFMLLLVGFGAMATIALRQSPPMADWAMALWFVPVIAGSYVLVGRMLPHVAGRFAEARLPLRLGAKELLIHRSASINAIIAVALLTGIGAAITVIERQHNIENQDPSRGYLEPAIWIAAIIAVLVLMVLYYVTLRSPEELTRTRSGLLRQGVDEETLIAADSHKALLVAGVGGTVGYVLGTITGTLLMVYRDQGDDVYAFKPLAMLPDLTTLIAIVLPVALAYVAGRLAGGRNRKVSLVAA